MPVRECNRSTELISFTVNISLLLQNLKAIGRSPWIEKRTINQLGIEVNRACIVLPEQTLQGWIGLPQDLYH